MVLGGGCLPQPRAQRSELFSLCVLCVLCVQCASQMPHQRWVGRAAERCSDATSSVGGGRVPPPGTPVSVRWQGPDSVRWKDPHQCALENICNGFLKSSIGSRGFAQKKTPTVYYRTTCIGRRSSEYVNIYVKRISTNLRGMY